MSEFKMPTEVVELPSKGFFYPESNPLSSGKIEMKYMTAKEEDILTNQSYIKQGIVVDKLVQSLIVSEINYDDLLIGDKDAILIAARVLGYGKDYEFNYAGESYTVDLTTLDSKPFDEKKFKKGENNFEYLVESTGTKITYKILTHGDEKTIEREIEGLRKVNKDSSSEVSTRLKYMITSVEGDSNPKTIRDFVDNYFLARDARAFRKHVNTNQPGVNTVFTTTGGVEVAIPVDLSFFWPDL
jgi:hypothetical protein